MDALYGQFELTRPAWLAALLVLLPLVVYSSRRSLAGFSRVRQAFSLACRVLLIVALTLALAGPSVARRTAEQCFVLAVDRSESIADASRNAQEAFVEEMIDAAGSDRVMVLPFAGHPAPTEQRHLGPGDAGLDTQGTNLAAAIEVAAAMVPSNRVPHVVVLTDGVQTDGDALRAAHAAALPISTVPLLSRGEPEVYVSTVRTNGFVREGEPFDIEVVVHSSHDDEGDVQLFRESRLVATERLAVTEGESRAGFTQTISGEPCVTFTARLEGFRDTLSENNSAVGVVFFAPRPRVLVIESEAQLARRLVAALEGGEIDVDVRRPEAIPESLADLAGYELVVLANVPARSLSVAQMDLIAAYVRDVGGGLIVVGGDQAFTPGGYRHTKLEEVLPVQCEFTETDERRSLAMVLVLDRSGSMEEGGAIELAKEATRRAVRLLDSKDRVGVIAFQDFAEWVSPIHPCSDREHVLERIDTIVAEGGTNMYPAMERAYLALRETPAELKHVIVLTDGVSHPGDFHALAVAMAEAGITVSTVAVGKEAVRPLLEDIARIGKGHHYHCDNAEAVPEIFALETATAGKMGIIEKPFRAQVTARLPALAKVDLQGAPSLLGYVETRPKTASQTVMTSERGDPLLIWWRYGRGVSVAFTSDVESRWAAAWLRWPGFSGFWAQLARHAIRKREADGFVLQVEQQNRGARVTLDAVDAKDRYVNDAEVALTVIDPEGVSRRLAVDQVSPGRYAIDLATPAKGVYYLELAVDDRGKRVFGERRGLAVGFPDELRTRPADHDLLRAIAEATGGVYDPRPAALAAPTDRTVPVTVLLWPYFLAAAMLIFVIDVIVRRLPRMNGRGGAEPAVT